MKKYETSSPRLKVRQAGFVIFLGTAIIFSTILVYSVLASRTGCYPRETNHHWGDLSGDLTASQSQLLTNFTGVNRIRIIHLWSEQDIPVTLTIMNSNNDVFLNITHPHPLTHSEYGSREFTLQGHFMSSSDDYITLTIQRISNDTSVRLVYEAYSSSTPCLDYPNPLMVIIIGCAIGVILIVSGFRTLQRVTKQASWE
ncbi:MAG: hypothetical protein ACFFCW_17510 [Candidatus Hodarchaeota archaeon]